MEMAHSTYLPAEKGYERCVLGMDPSDWTIKQYGDVIIFVLFGSRVTVALSETLRPHLRIHSIVRKAREDVIVPATLAAPSR